MPLDLLIKLRIHRLRTIYRVHVISRVHLGRYTNNTQRESFRKKAHYYFLIDKQFVFASRHKTVRLMLKQVLLAKHIKHLTCRVHSEFSGFFLALVVVCDRGNASNGRATEINRERERKRKEERNRERESKKKTEVIYANH